jgi:hypothetical protein
VPAPILVRTIEEATDMSPQEIAVVWSKMDESPFRKVIQYEIEAREAMEQKKLTLSDPANFQKQQGIVTGLSIALGILNRPANIKHPNA